MAELADAARLDGAYRDSRKRSPAKVAIRIYWVVFRHNTWYCAPRGTPAS
jgi:hypothetical protein